MDNTKLTTMQGIKRIIAVDPGAQGGIAVQTFGDNPSLVVTKMPDTPKDLLDFLAQHKEGARAYIEKVGGMPGQGGSAMFNFGKGYGNLEMALIALQIPTETVTPQKWQKALQLGTKGTSSKTQWKNKLKARAQLLYPSLKITLALADALLLLEYAKRDFFRK